MISVHNLNMVDC